MRPWAILAMALLLVGCGSRWTTSNQTGRRIPRYEYAFLNETNVTRKEVLATLGPPNYDSPDQRVLIYWWGYLPVNAQWNVGSRRGDSFEIYSGGFKSLLIEFNAAEIVTRHELVHSKKDEPLDAIATKWRRLEPK